MKKLLLLTTLLGSLFAEINTEVVISANKFEQTQKSVTSNIDIIGKETIEELSIKTALEAINLSPSVNFTQNGGVGQQSSLYLQGMATERTLVLVDGVKINDTTTIGQQAVLEQILADDIERIEILKGSQSGIYGADASAGVINIITKGPSKEGQTIFKIEGGSYGTENLYFQASQDLGKLDYKLSFQKFKTDGITAAEPKKGSADYGKKTEDLGWEKDDYENKTVDVKLGFETSENGKLTVQRKIIDALVSYDGGAGSDAKDVDNLGWGTSNYFNKIDNTFTNYKYEHTIKKSKLSVNKTDATFKRSQAGGYEGTRDSIEIKAKMPFKEDGTIVLGSENETHTLLKSAGTSFDKSYEGQGFFASMTESIDNTTYNISFRNDSYSSFDGKNTYKAGAKYSFSRKMALLANIGTSYKVPSLYQLHAATYGNSSLTPEDTKSKDVSFVFSDYKLTYFQYEINNMIGAHETTYKYLNETGTSKIKGTTLSAKQQLPSLRSILSLSYTVLDAKNKDDEKLARRPDSTFKFSFDHYPNEKIAFNISGTYIGERYDKANEQGAQTGKYAVFNATLNYKLNKVLKTFVKINNIADKHYQVVDGYATPGRNYYVGLKGKF